MAVRLSGRVAKTVLIFSTENFFEVVRAAPNVERPSASRRFACKNKAARLCPTPMDAKQKIPTRAE
jgi:hypothetical protein